MERHGWQAKEIRESCRSDGCCGTRLDGPAAIYNILKGDMSIVGPRPERPELAAELEKEIPEFHSACRSKQV